MPDAWTDRWDKRYQDSAFAYGELPNNYLTEQLVKLPVGRILFPAEGEGRNAVFAARLGWQVSAFDISRAGQQKARQLAQKNGVQLDYQVGELQDLRYQAEQFDAIALIYAHFPAAVKAALHRMLGTYLRKGGTIIFEAFSKRHLDYLAKNEQVGGPKDIDSLFSLAEIRADFPDYTILELQETEVTLQEGLYHNGLGSVIRFVGQKN